MRNEARFVDPFELPKEKIEKTVVSKNANNNDRSSCYDVDLHDNFDWLAQPCVAVSRSLGQGGRSHES